MLRHLVYMLVLGMLSSVVWARPVFETRVYGEMEQVLERLTEALAAHDHAVRQTLDVGLTIRNRGSDFMPMMLMVLEGDEAIVQAVEEDPRLAVFLPATLAVYEKREGRTKVVVVDHSRLMAFFDLSPAHKQALDESFERIYTALETLGPVRRASGGLTTVPPYVLGTVEDLLEDATFLYTSSYQGQNMSQVGDMTLGSVWQEWFCSATFAEQIFKVEPAVATGAPCRIFAFERDGQVYIGAANPHYVQAAFPTITADAEAGAAFEAMTALNTTVFDEMYAEPIEGVAP